MRKATQVRIFAGTGGVGKTTLASAQAFLYALDGFKTLVITIDPSQRLKTALRLSPHSLNQRVLFSDNVQKTMKGELWASLLDSKWIFDDFVKRGLNDEEKILKLFKNRLYQQLSTQLNGSQEFTSLEKVLYEVESGVWDYIVLDTPPAGHAIDFLRAPQKLNRLLDERIARWFRAPEHGGSWMANIFAFGAKRIMNILELLTGSEFIHELSDFFGQIQFWQEKLEKRLHAVDALLHSLDCQFSLVTHYDLSKLREGVSFLKTLAAQNLMCERVIVNRAYLEPVFFEKEPISPGVKQWYQSFAEYYAEYAWAGKQFLTKELGRSVPVIEIPDRNWNFSAAENQRTELEDLMLIVDVSHYLRTSATMN